MFIKDTNLTLGLYTLSSNALDILKQAPFSAAQITMLKKVIYNTITIANTTRAPKEALILAAPIIKENKYMYYLKVYDRRNKVGGA
jgi:hypothetical protein